MHVLHVSTECYPAAKVGGLGDVVGALPKYLNQLKVTCDVVIPKYHNPWILEQRTNQVYSQHFKMGTEFIYFEVQELLDTDLGFPLYFIHIPGKFDRPGIYYEPGIYYQDELQRSVSFQRAVLEWLIHSKKLPDVIHCHDHHTGLIPFMLQYSPDYNTLASVPTFFTIHNAAYQGAFSWHNAHLLPAFDAYKWGLLDWRGLINSLAAGIRTAWRVTTVSNSYMEELRFEGHGLEWIFNNEYEKCLGIINGIDSKVWDPGSDPLISVHAKGNADIFKDLNKKELCEHIRLDPELPLYIYIGRMAYEKGADFLATLLGTYLQGEQNANYVILGTGDPGIETGLSALEQYYPNHVRAFIQYNEELAHRLYAAGDFILMPSRVEPCGLNQMYSMRYGGIPIVRAIGGLKDTVEPITSNSGNGYLFEDLNLSQCSAALTASRQLYDNKQVLSSIRTRNMRKDFSWERSANDYIKNYKLTRTGKT
jgi:starch synthase